MKINTYEYPKSSFLSIEKDMSLIVNTILKNNRLKKLLYYTTSDCLTRPNLSEDESLSLFNNNIKIVPKIPLDGSIRTYLVVSFDDFTLNDSNPEFRDNLIEFDIICHLDQWMLKDFELRPYKIAAELDSMFNNKKLTGIGTLQFQGASQLPLSNEYGGICLMYQAIHGDEDKKGTLNPADQEGLDQNFDDIFNV